METNNNLYVSNVLIDSCDSEPEDPDSVVSSELFEHVNLLFASSDLLAAAAGKNITECIVDALYNFKKTNEPLALKYQELIEDLTITQAAYVLISETGAPNLANRLFGVLSRKVTSLMYSSNYSDLQLAILAELSGFRIGFEFEKISE